MSRSRFYPYVSSVVQLRPETARTSFDFACRCLTLEAPSRLGEAAPHWIVEGDSGRLFLAGEVARAETEHGPLRAVRGTLRPAGWARYPVAVQLELLPWSRSKSELGLIHAARAWWAPSERQHQAYLRAAHDILGVLRRALEGPPPDWLSRLVSAPPAPISPPGRAGRFDPAAVARN